MSTTSIFASMPLLFLVSFLASCVSKPPKSSAERCPQGMLPMFSSQAVSSQGLFARGIEGPAVDLENNLYVVNFARSGTVAIMRPGKEPELWLELPQGGVGNSIRFNSQGRMLIADLKNHRVLEVDPATKEVFLSAENPRMNQPNDFAVSTDGTLFLSDPSWSTKKSGSIWRMDSQRQLQVAATDLRAVNGIDLSPLEEKLYFTESIGGGLWSFDIVEGQLENKKLVYQFQRDTVDGMRIDGEGAIYVARITKGQIDRISPEGNLLQSIRLIGKEPTNLAFGGPDGKTVYVTMRDGGYIESFRAPVAGREWLLQKSQSRR